tara:strand:- start:177 stop:383 length:207 start_codon:yes stop_codon:yes gene_type:complete
MLKMELISSNYDKTSVYNNPETKPAYTETEKTECSLSSLPFDPTKSSPKDKFISKIFKRMEKYYEISN